jgi:hypothetical protein
LTAVLVAIATAANAARLTGYWAVCDSHRRWLSRPGIVPSDVLADAVAGQGPFAARGPATDLRVLFAGQADMFTLVRSPGVGHPHGGGPARHEQIAHPLVHARVLYIGRGPAFGIALEGALKLKEISYIHAEG